MMNKRGSEIVEAAIVLPIFVLIVLSLIGALVFQFSALRESCSVQRDLVDAIREERAIMKRVARSGGTSSQIEGWYRGTLSKSYDAYGYAIDEAKILRLGGEFIE